MIERIKKTAFFAPVKDEIDGILDPKNFVGRSALQCERYCGEGGPVQVVTIG